jgi:tRNA dimethylallyltransferase
MLYFRALTRGPGRPAAAQTRVRRRSRRAPPRGWPALHAELASVDSATRGAPRSQRRQRIQRALEVHRLTGARFRSCRRRPREPGLRALQVALEPSDARVPAPAHRRALPRDAGRGPGGGSAGASAPLPLDGDLPSMRAVGYRQVWERSRGRSRGARWPRAASPRRASSPSASSRGCARGPDRSSASTACARDLAEAVEARVGRYLSLRRGT